MIRPFDLRDISMLQNYRESGIFLDSIPTLTWGRTLVPAAAMLSPIAPATGVFTSVYLGDKTADIPLIGQVVHVAGSPYARFTFLAPDSAVESPALPELLEDLMKRVGGRGAKSIVAEVDENSHTFEALRRAGFSIYARQRIWRVETSSSNGVTSPWRKAQSVDEFPVRTLYNGIVPGFVQAVESAPQDRLRGKVYYEDSELFAFVDMVHGPSGVWMQPYIHHEADKVTGLLESLINEVPPRNTRPVYLCLRSYQSWLEHGLEDLGGEAGPRQAVMVKRMALTRKVGSTLKLPVVESGQAEITTPISAPTPEVWMPLINVTHDPSSNN